MHQHHFTTYGPITHNNERPGKWKSATCTSIWHLQWMQFLMLLMISWNWLSMLSCPCPLLINYVVFSKNTILLQDRSAWNHCTAEHCTWEIMKLHLRDAQKDLSSLLVASKIYPQAKITHISGVINTMLSSYGTQPPTPTDASFFSASSTVSQQNSQKW